MIILGSKAMLSQLPATYHSDEFRLKNRDYDVIMTWEEFQKWQTTFESNIDTLYPTEGNKYKASVYNNFATQRQYEIEIAFPGTSADFLHRHLSSVSNGVEVKGLVGETFYALSLPYLLLTKRSHLIFPVHFEKNVKDYHLLKEYLGEFTRNEHMNTYYELRSKEAENRYKQRTPKLNVSNEDFFSSKLIVERFFIHDDIHETMKHHEKPVYEMMKKDFDSAWCEKDMFFELPHEMQVQAVQEEAYTIALERYIVPKHGSEWSNHFSCYERAVKRICTTLCSGWFRDFAIENYPTVMKQYNKDFVQKFISAYDNGDIKTIENKIWTP